MSGEGDDPDAPKAPAKEGEEQADGDSEGPDDAETFQVKIMESARSSPPAAEAADRPDPMLPTKSAGSRAGGGRRTIRASTAMPSSAADDDPTSPSMSSGLLSPKRLGSKAASDRPEVRFALSDSRTGTKSPARAMSKAQSEGGDRQPASAPRMSRVSSLASRTSTMRTDMMSVSSSSSVPFGTRASTLTQPGGGRRATRLHSMPANLEKEAAKSKKAPEEEAMSSKEDVWDLLLLNENGQRLRDICVEDFAEHWQQLRDMGLDLKLAEVLRDMSPKAADSESERKEKPKLVGNTLSGEHMRQLAMMLIRDQSIEGPLEDDEKKEEFLMELQMAVDTGKEVDGDMRISYKNFKKLITLGAWILCIDEAYVYTQLVWARVGRFEMTSELFQAVTAIAKWSQGQYEFKRNQLDIMMHSNGILIRTQKAGLVWGNFHGQFDRFLLQKQDLLRRRQEQKNDERTQDRRENFAKGHRPQDAVCGRTEFSMWLETLFAFTKQADSKVYKSPLQMCADWMRCARKLEDFSDTEDENDNDDDTPHSPNNKAAPESDKIILDAKRQEGEAAQLKDQFKKLDVNCKGSLTFEQFCAFLLQGSPHLTEKELRGLFKLADTNKDGIVIFKEFVDFVHSSTDDMYEEAPMPAPDGVKSVFRDYCSYQSEQMDMFHFTKMLRDSGLIDKDLTLAEVELIFNQVRSTKSKTLTLGGVERALKHCADKKGVEQGDLYEALWHLRRGADEPPPGSETPGGRTNSKAKVGANLIRAGLTFLSANRKGSKTPAESTTTSPQPSGRLRVSHVAPNVNTPAASPRPADKIRQTLPALSAAKSTPNLKQAAR